ncbi:hypothetical protein G7Y89_g7011 [Cudoniella acicularis]|uniref:Heterokaryon incompatibility domain-containing protein n=1 Tax=Cudoniella acicularis TaxID=354080 RepID=A0A8H4W482_9HELO|nr:hypothetical protein G7Y89_g7011 [Cudoniella acicularis]
MSAIYRKATEVVVWLGHGDHIAGLVVKSPSDGEPWHLDQKARTLNLRAIRELLSRPYWKRVWVIQEVAVASKVNVYYGRHKITWEAFVNLCRNFFESNESTEIVQSDDEIFSGLTILREFRKDILSRRPISMLDALLRSRSSLSTERRDKLYALLGLAFDAKNFIIEPNYIISVEACFTKFATALIQNGEPLDFIYLRSAKRSNENELPSDASCATINISETELIASGVFIDTIDNLGSVFTISERDKDEQTESSAAKLLFELRGGSLNGIPRDLVRPLGIWLAKNLLFVNDERTIEFWSKILNARRIETTGGVTHVAQYYHDVIQSQMRLVKTSRGHYGWVHPQAQEGDKIFKINGCSQFVVLREIDNVYCVVGDAILSGSVSDDGPKMILHIV